MNSQCSLTTAKYKHAVAKIIRDLQAEHGLSDIAFAERIGCCLGTIRKARNEESELGGMFLGRIEAEFGQGSIDPYLNLAGARSVPIEATADTDPLPAMTAAVHKLAVARSPSSPGGVRELPSELFDMLPDLKEQQKAVTALICRIEAMRDAA